MTHTCSWSRASHIQSRKVEWLLGYYKILNPPVRFLHSSADVSEISTVMSMDKNVSTGSVSKTFLDNPIH